MPSGTCVIWGDPHILTFDQKRVDFYTPGQYWLVKSASVWIQGEYRPTHATSGLSVMKKIAFGGPFLQSNKLIISSTVATFNGQVILASINTEFNQGGVVAKYDTLGATMQKGREGKAMKVIHLSLPSGVNVQINRWTESAEGNYINAKISMPSGIAIDGHCGNFNGNQVDDDRIQIRARVGKTGVSQADLLFDGTKIPVINGNRPDLNDCATAQLDTAHTTCKEKEHKFIPSMACLIDVCFGGVGFAQQG
jgi:hypothetical protein